MTRPGPDPDRPWNSWLERSADPADWAREQVRQQGEQLRPKILSVGDVTRAVRDGVRAAPGLRNVWVEGEVGQYTVSAAGHCYFTLKDERSQLRCMIFRDDRMVMSFEPRSGLRMVAHGRIDVFEPQGHYQLYVDSLQPAGFGDLALRLEEMKARLAAEGLFDPTRKRPLPPWPRTVGLATSASGAVLHDVVKVLGRRWPLVRVVFAPCVVQGDAAPISIVAALSRLARWRDRRSDEPLDVVILARGGGSLEDLWAFNDEKVVRAVAKMPIPVVVGVGHETDVTLAEFAADVRAATPSVAAELSVPSRDDQAAHLALLDRRLRGATAATLAAPRRALESERRALDSLRPAAVLASERERIGLLLDRAARSVTERLASSRVRVERSGERLPLLANGRLARGRASLDGSRGSLAALSPYATLERGYAIVRDAEGRIVRDATTRAPGERLEVQLARGGLDVRVESVRDSLS